MNAQQHPRRFAKGPKAAFALIAACTCAPARPAPAAHRPPPAAQAASAATRNPARASGAAPGAAAAALPAPMDAEQLLAMLDRAIRWYRTQQADRSLASRPSDWLIVSQNARTARLILAQAFEIARADARLLAKTPGSAEPSGQSLAPNARLVQFSRKLAADRSSIDAEMAASRQDLARAHGRARTALQAKLSELQGERDLADARISIIDAMLEFADGKGSADASAGSLKAQIDAMALALGGADGAKGAAPPLEPATAVTVPAAGAGTGGLWQLAHEVWNLADRRDKIAAEERAAAALQDSFAADRAPLISHVRAMAARGDALAAAADSADASTLVQMRPQLDALAGQFREMSGLLVPFGRLNVLLDQYRGNVRSWHDAVGRQYREALTSLAIRSAILLTVLVGVFIAAEFWKRAVYRYSHDARRRYQLLLVRSIVSWALVLLIVGLAFANEIGSVATLAGLITAGLAVAMQSVLVSIVGYFFLIGKYGIRVGDRVQIGEVTGEVIDLGLVRMHLMELGGRTRPGPTGRVVAFANSVVFQVSSGLFKQIPGVELNWHEVKLTLPTGSDPVVLKARLLAAANAALGEYRADIDRQAARIEEATASRSGGRTEPQVQLQFGANAVDALVRYPVYVPHAAEIDERVSKEIAQVVGEAPAPA
ncbi:MAG: mechanosensitive ion channel [Gammaproteobacteria bacterium]|nr:mechanosensitive ion channel [Gammaproteobacteria bacterium]